MNTRVVNKYKDNYDVYIGRPSVFGNPYIEGEDGNRNEVIEKFRIYFYNRIEKDEKYKEKVLSLKGKKLGCFCKPRSCHGDIYVEYLENEQKLYKL